MAPRAYFVLLATMTLASAALQPPSPAIPIAGDVVMTTDRPCYAPGDLVQITAIGWATVSSVGDFPLDPLVNPGIFWAVADAAGNPVFQTINAFDAVSGFNGTLEGTWDQTYRLYGFGGPPPPPTGEQVPNGTYVIWFYEYWVGVPQPSWVVPATITIGPCSAAILLVQPDKACYALGEPVTITLWNAGTTDLTWWLNPPPMTITDALGNVVVMPPLDRLPYVVTVAPGDAYPVSQVWPQTYLIFDASGLLIPPTGDPVPQGTYTIAVTADDPPGTAGSATIQIGACGAGVCPLSQGYWKNHEGAWPVTELTLGAQTYHAAALLDLLRTPPRGDASLILAHQLIAAKLNVANGADATPIAAAIADADNQLETHGGTLPYGVKPSTAEGQAMTAAAGTLDEYDNGRLTTDCADP